MGDEKPCLVARPPNNNLERVHGLIHEYLDVDVRDLRSVVIPLIGPMLVGTATDTDEYIVPAESMLLIHAIHGHLLMRAPTGESAAIPGIGNPRYLARVALTAANCKIALTNNENKLQIFEGSNDLTLLTLIGAGGSRPLHFEVPHKVIRGQKILMTTSLVDTTASIIGGSTEYGVVIHGTLVKTMESK